MRPVFDCAGEGADVDEVVFLADPFVFCVVDYEFYVWWEPIGVSSGKTEEGREERRAIVVG